MPAQWLVHAADAQVGPGVLIGLETTPADAPASETMAAIEQAVLALRAKGVQVGWGPEFGAKILPDFALLRQGAHAMSTLLDSKTTWPAEWQGLPVLVTDIGNVEELEMALYNGVTYACGALDHEVAPAEPAARHAVPPEVRRVGLLLNQLASGADTAVIVGAIKGDVGLSYRLLRLINKASYAQLGGHASVEQAVLLLGRYELYRWLSMLLVQFAGSRKVSSALQEMTLWRSRLLELMAIDQQETSPDQFFTLGLASMLGQILKISEAEVASTINLAAYASQALLEHSGPWHPYLEMVKRLEARTLDLTAELAPQFSDTARLLMLSDLAWRWAAEQTPHIDSPDAGTEI
jgi:EAL and modified HD-GYP domain-containing signal transduction protein